MTGVTQTRPGFDRRESLFLDVAPHISTFFVVSAPGGRCTFSQRNHESTTERLANRRGRLHNDATRRCETLLISRTTPFVSAGYSCHFSALRSVLGMQVFASPFNSD